MATSIATMSYSARKRVGVISLAGSNFAPGSTRPRPRTTPRIGGPAAKLASGSISYLQPDPAAKFPMTMGQPIYGYAENGPLRNTDPNGLWSTNGCSDDQIRQIAVAMVRLGRVGRGMSPENPSGPRDLKCGGCEFVPPAARSAQLMTYHCREGSGCGWARHPEEGITFEDITLYPGAFDRQGPNGCGCLEATILHENLHGTLDHDAMQPAVKKCFPCAQNP